MISKQTTPKSGPSTIAEEILNKAYPNAKAHTPTKTETATSTYVVDTPPPQAAQPQKTAPQTSTPTQVYPSVGAAVLPAPAPQTPTPTPQAHTRRDDELALIEQGSGLLSTRALVALAKGGLTLEGARLFFNIYKEDHRPQPQPQPQQQLPNAAFTGPVDDGLGDLAADVGFNSEAAQHRQESAQDADIKIMASMFPDAPDLYINNEFGGVSKVKNPFYTAN